MSFSSPDCTYLDRPDSLGAGRSRQALDTYIYFGTEPSLQCVTKRTTDMPVHRNAYRIHRSFGKRPTSARKAKTVHSSDESNVSSRLLRFLFTHFFLELKQSRL